MENSLAYISSDRTGLRVRNLTTNAETPKAAGPKTSFTALVFSPDNNFIGAGTSDGTVQLLSSPTLKTKWTDRRHSGAVQSISFSRDGSLIVCGSWDSSISTWEAQTGKQLGLLEGHTAVVNGVSFAPSADTVASASSDGSVRLWNVASGKLEAKLDGCEDEVRSVASHSTGTWSRGEIGDLPCTVWSTATHRLLASIPGYAGFSLAFLPNESGRCANRTATCIRLSTNTVVTASARPVSDSQILNVEHWVRTIGFVDAEQPVLYAVIDNEIRRWQISADNVEELPRIGIEFTSSSAATTLTGTLVATEKSQRQRLISSRAKS